MGASQGTLEPGTHPLVAAIEAIYRARIYEGDRVEGGISLELIGAISGAAAAAGLGGPPGAARILEAKKEKGMDVYDEIRAERGYQGRRWGPLADQQDDTRNTPWMWCAYIAQHATRWMSGGFAPIGGAATNSFRTCMVKVAALAVAAAESVDRQRAEKGHAFYE